VGKSQKDEELLAETNFNDKTRKRAKIPAESNCLSQKRRAKTGKRSRKRKLLQGRK